MDWLFLVIPVFKLFISSITSLIFIGLFDLMNGDTDVTVSLSSINSDEIPIPTYGV